MQYRAWVRRRVSVRFAKYFGVGMLAFVIDVGTFFLIRNFAHQSIFTSNACAITAGALVSFVLNHLWVFEHKISAKKSSARWVGFLINALIGFAFSTYVVHVASRISQHSRYASRVALVELFAKVGAIGVVVLWNYFIYRTVIFRHADGTA